MNAPLVTDPIQEHGWLGLEDAAAWDEVTGAAGSKDSGRSNPVVSPWPCPWMALGRRPGALSMALQTRRGAGGRRILSGVSTPIKVHGIEGAAALLGGFFDGWRCER